MSVLKGPSPVKRKEFRSAVVYVIRVVVYARARAFGFSHDDSRSANKPFHLIDR